MFEYKTVTLTAFEASDPRSLRLNQAGGEGWELVGVVVDPGHEGNVLCFMKRPSR